MLDADRHATHDGRLRHDDCHGLFRCPLSGNQISDGTRTVLAVGNRERGEGEAEGERAEFHIGDLSTFTAYSNPPNRMTAISHESTGAGGSTGGCVGGVTGAGLP